ncbi:semaphorin 5c [Periplaneta americana]|uniref:semaphorin 5c n=1 Tax=Periplaneta americana TaxID=6978 RepID=UPI0037E7BE10
MSFQHHRHLLLVLAVTSLWPCIHADFRFISFEDLLPTADRFTDSSVTSFSQLLFDVSRDQVIVGARDTLYRLSLRELTELQKASWLAPPEKAELCQNKGQTEEHCHNFIKVLLTTGKRIFTCGTNAFSPQCSWREIENVSSVLEWVKGVARCPYSPQANVTALLTRSGQYFAGSPLDFSGTDLAISRTSTEISGSTIRTKQFDSKWLNEPQFVGSFETSNFVYFLFRESAVEYINCGKIIYSRIARVCKNDSGGQFMLKDNWTTFVKARLNCSIPGEYPFYFDEIQGMAYVESEDMVYATFTTPSNSIPGSAICAFNMSSITAAFSGPFKHQEHPGSAWERHVSPHKRHFECQSTPSQSHSHQLLDSNRYQLMDSAVQPATLHPLYTGRLETLTHIAIHVLPTKLHRAVHMMYVATADGLVKKISVLPRTQETCVVEIWKPYVGDTPVPIKALHYLKDTDSVYIGTEESVMRVPAQHCSRLHSRVACQNAMDPYCGWNELKEQCTPAPNHDPLSGYWKQSVTQCPVLTNPVDGGWSSWSSWFPCAHQTDTGSSSSISSPSPGEDQCRCRTRQCNNPPPQNGGSPCSGIAVAVTNCTVHGGWTAWSSWSACSQSCGLAVKTQRRVCGNPAPAHGGRVCVGQDRNEIYCTSNPPCPAMTPPPRDGQWGSWGPWDECSAPCGGGYRIRRRRCDNPAPQDGGQECQGCNLDYELCNVHACSESKRLSSWTPWLAANASLSPAGYTERRFRFSCRAPVADPALIKVAQAKEEERFCHNDGNCLRTGRGEMDDVWSEWSNWSPCSVECGGGNQHRTRTCEGRAEECEGPSRMSRICNSHACKGEWGCWTDWSGCSVTCGQGVRRRTRHCLSLNNNGIMDSGCEGTAVGEEPCEVISCESLLGWEPWTVWSLCDNNAEQHRRRKCLATNPGPQLCQGHDRETRMCVFPDANDLNPLGVHSGPDSGGSGAVSLGIALGSCVAAFIVGLFLMFVLCYLYFRRRRPRIPGSPHYITSKQNPYVTVPLKEVGSHHTKRAPSFSSSASSSNGSTPGSHKASNGGSGISIGTPKLFAKPLVEYETATIKRNSHSLANGHMRTDLDQDKFF